MSVKEMVRSGVRRNMMMREDAGFSLVELLIVVIIIGILAGIAVPIYINQREQAYAAAVQSDLRNAATAATTCSADHDGLYSGTGFSCNIATLRTTYGFSSSDNVTITEVAVTADRWAANASYTGRAGTLFSFDTRGGSQVKPGNIGS